jgi:CHAT domain-containing protein/tetratricopeptide (TPR) repeat protein
MRVRGTCEQLWTAAALGVLALIAPVHAALPAAEASFQPGGAGRVIVDSVAPGGAAHQAGIKPNDVVTSIAIVPRAADLATQPKGEANSTFDLIEAEYEFAGRATITLHGSRDGNPASWPLPPGRWRLRVRPVLPAAIQRQYEEGKALLDAKDDRGLDVWRTAATAAETMGDSVNAVWLEWQVARAIAPKDPPQSRSVLRSAMQRALRHSRNIPAAVLSRELGLAYQATSEWKQAVDAFAQAQTWWATVHPSGLGVAQLLNDQGVMADWQGDAIHAEALHRQALDIRQRVAPGSADEQMSLSNLGSVAYSRGDLDAAIKYMRGALAIAEKNVPGTLEHASALQNVGAVLSERGVFGEAHDHLVRALDVTAAVSPEGPEMADRLLAVGIMDTRRGDLVTAEERLRRAVESYRRLNPRHPTTAQAQMHLGVALQFRGNYVAAEDAYQQARALLAEIAPASPQHAEVLANLGSVAGSRGDYAMAERWVLEALRVYEAIEKPASTGVAGMLQHLSRLAVKQELWVRAQKNARQALDIFARVAPDHHDRSSSWETLGDIDARRGRWQQSLLNYTKALDARAALGERNPASATLISKQARANAGLRRFATAARLHRQANEILAQVAPATLRYADALHAFGEMRRTEGKPVAARALFVQAADVLDTQQGSIGGSDEQRSGFSAEYLGIYDDAIDALASVGQGADAFAVLERSRARSLLTLLAERDLVFEGDVPPELARERRLIDAEYEATLRELGAPPGVVRVNGVDTRLRDLRGRRAEIARRIRQSSPRLAELQYPEPLDAAGVRRSVDAGTAVLSYWVGSRRSLVFVIPAAASGAAAPNVSVFEIPAGETTLRQIVGQLRAQMPGTRAPNRAVGGITARRATPTAADVRLYSLLIAPAEKLVATADRILILPDGPLHQVPFAALRRSKNGTRSGSFLIEWKPLHLTVSATVYQQLQMQRSGTDNDAQRARLVAFGDPVYHQEQPQGQSRGRLLLAALPGTRREVQAIAARFPQRATVYLGADATEERARAIPAEATYVHFATHGVLDNRRALDTALALTVPSAAATGGRDGWLQTWEVFEHVRLRASLVTLSACETALGSETGGEGLLGLTRAFHYAGARSVLASIWSVSDDSTADLMSRFYGHLAAGHPKDVALRQAQIESIKKGGRSAEPFHWAAFQLYGDWR